MTSGDLFHVSRAPDATDWSPPQQVNSQPHSVTGVGPIDGGQMAIDPDGRLHVAWFHNDSMQFHYTRSDGAGGFEKQQVLSVKDEGGVESGPTVTADGAGNVYVFWHADDVEDARRRVYMAVSRNNRSNRPVRLVRNNSTRKATSIRLPNASAGSGSRMDLSRSKPTGPTRSPTPPREPRITGRLRKS